MAIKPPDERKQTHNNWTVDERDLLQKYFDVAWTPLTLFKHLHKLNPMRTYESMSRELRRMKGKGWVRPSDRALDSLRVGYLDIESTDLDCEFGGILCWCIKARGVDRIDSDCISKRDVTTWNVRDKRMMKTLLDAFSGYDVLYTHYGEDRRFDYPMIRSRALYWNLEHLLPQQGEAFIFDTWKIARNKLRMKSNRLDRIAKFLHIDVEKTSLDPEIWAAARIGEKLVVRGELIDSLEYIYDHCKKDVLVLEKVHERIRCVERPIYRSV